MKHRGIAFCLLVGFFFLMSGCATNLTKPTRLTQPSTVKFSEFENVEMKTVDISPAFSAHSANQKARRKIDELLFRDMGLLFPNLKRVDESTVFSDTAVRTLQITPSIQEIKFIGGAARFWVGAMAGSSAILMETTFRDSSTGEIIANPQFYRASGSYAGAYSFGQTDNNMLEDIVDDIVKYSSYNK